VSNCSSRLAAMSLAQSDGHIRQFFSSTAPRDDVHDVVEVEVEAELRQASAFELAEEARALLAQDEDVVSDVAETAIETAIAIVDDLEAVTRKQARERLRRKVVQMRGRMNHAPLPPAQARVEALN